MGKELIIKGADFSTNAILPSSEQLSNNWLGGYYNEQQEWVANTGSYDTTGIYVLQAGYTYRLTGLSSVARVYAFTDIPEEGTVPATCDYRTSSHPAEGYTFAKSGVYAGYAAFAVMQAKNAKTALTLTKTEIL